jgi:hypothetical protein
MNAVLRRLIHERLQDEIDPSLSEPAENKFYGGGDVEGKLLGSREHYAPASLLKVQLERRRKKILVRSRWTTRVTRRDPDTGAVITLQQTMGEDAEAIYVPIEEDPTPPSDCSPRPPLNAEYALQLFLRGDERDAVIGDLLERYAGKHERFGERRAKLWFYGEVVRSLWPLLKRLAAKAGGLIALGEWIRRHVS